MTPEMIDKARENAQKGGYVNVEFRLGEIENLPAADNSVDVIVSRIQEGTQRPALTAGKTFTEEVAEVLERRIPKYKSAAQFEIDTDPLTPEQVAERIIQIWQKA